MNSSPGFAAAPERYAALPYERAGRSGLRLPKISLGLWNNFGTDRSADTQSDIVLHAFDRGVTHFDLANNYGPPPGAAECRFGEIIAHDLLRYRDELVVSTKAGYDMWQGPHGSGGSRKHMLASLDQSLARLNLDYVDIFYSHRPDPDTPIEETASALADAVRFGKALYVGISNYSPEETVAAAEALESEGVPLSLHQPRYNMFDRVAEQGLFDVLIDLGIGSVAYAPLAGGLLSGRYLKGSAPSGSRGAASRWFDGDATNPDYLLRVAALQEIASARGQTLPQLALTWALRHKAVTSALIGASSVNQLDDCLDSLRGDPLTNDEVRAVDDFAVDGTAP
ncbi:hypothetical protein AX769_03920 [Frondihabitans sp. PAMC 28766]|uniref:aldo/keto reductase n=1 Tax=Frondihabitans sp. PAMC 28766 TaxID=1795630 RepID=UPI00078D3CDE|nr:aldo/keto reductase [Frondihabitans sp. PAMC 28766]AMM19446.1 hypothetical protein AX769_03920 [Frondihabitans sp. PAMC 28766]